MSATRQLAYRARVASGRAVVPVEIDLIEVVEMLLAGGLLRDWTEDRQEIADALARQIRILADLHALSLRGDA